MPQLLQEHIYFKQWKKPIDEKLRNFSIESGNHLSQCDTDIMKNATVTLTILKLIKFYFVFVFNWKF